MAFHFRYENLLRYRKQLLEREQCELGKILAQLQKVENEYNELEQLKTQYDKLLDERGENGISAEEYILLMENRQGLEYRLSQMERVLREWRKKADIQRQKVVEAKKNVETLETLKNIEREEYRKEQNRREQKNSDEIAILRNQGATYEG
ncbi:MAG: flagellar export protein FliJ [Deltaproteobacteria bacterium]|nr:flagellar export protein FliJ [Deltaproteobacteria bacterium]MBW2068623.1 flagellar export protein FliJ [Deltaproteobacteria bacterium]